MMKSLFECIMSVKSVPDLFEFEIDLDKTQQGVSIALVSSSNGPRITLVSSSKVRRLTNESRSPQNEVRHRTLSETIQGMLDRLVVNEKSLILAETQKLIEKYENDQKRLNKRRSTDPTKISSTILEMMKAKHSMRKALNNPPAAFDEAPNLTSEVADKSIFRSRLLSGCQPYETIIVQRSQRSMRIPPLSAPEKFYIELPYPSLTTSIDEIYEEIFPAVISTPSPEFIPITNQEKVFIVHGHDHPARDAVAEFVNNWGLTATILDKEPNKGRTIIEKFEDLADEASFAIVLFTPDDVGASVKDKANLKPRARQNVILELGYFLKAVGRQQICILHKGDIELPSDIHGLLYIPMDDAGEWKEKVIKEMVEAQVLANANKI